MDTRKIEELYTAFESADTIVLKKYVNALEKLSVYDSNIEPIKQIQLGGNVCLYHIEKIVYDAKENIHDKLTTIYSSLYSDKQSALALLLQGTTEQVNLYVGVVSRKTNSDGKVLGKTLDNMGNAFRGVAEGHFPGMILKRVSKDDTEELLTNVFSGVSTVASVSAIAALRNQNEKRSEEFVQGMEKLIDSMRGKSYTALYLADVMDIEKIESLCAEYEDIYAQLSPFKQSVHTLNENTTSTDTTSMVEGVVDTTNESLAKSITHGTSHSITKTNTFGGGINGGVKLGEIVNIGASLDYHHSRGTTDGTNDSNTETETTGKAKSLTTQNSVSQALAKGTGESLQITYDNRAVRTLLERIDEQIKRLRSCEDFGVFDSCVYFLSNKYENAVSAASTYKSIIRGENSSVEASAINVWTDKEHIAIISEYLKKFYHPLFALNDYLNVTPALLVSGRELSFQFSLPKKSVAGIPIVECTEFSREIVSLNEAPSDIHLGKVFHMHNEEEKDVLLDAGALTAHTFITGSTGSGKSTTIYKLLDEISSYRCNDDSESVKFMVIEPAKGEYKKALAKNKKFNVNVYGTNPKLTKLLRINPFKFPSDKIHIYEHLDKLTEIFNVCWPMYAAMPAVLKAAMENAYRSAGWNLVKSENEHGDIFPSFIDVALEVEKYINKSEYSDENKSNYKGSLLTRLESLTNGINSMIFSANDIEDVELFDENVIIDLSRVGSTETKALIMGILVLKLQEYRIATTENSNTALKHITVLEEAHNLLKRTSTEQSSESSNLLGKSVEMLANSIAEMRTYGEGFIIADQSPGLLDLSVIRNTNTKIIMRLPDFSDRELVGKAAGLNDQQIAEISRLPRGVAAVYQSDWISPVLCKVQRPNLNEGDFSETEPSTKSITENVLFDLLDSKFRTKLDNVSEEEAFRQAILRSSVSTDTKIKLLDYLDSKDSAESIKILSTLIYDYFKNTKETLEMTVEETSPEMLKMAILSELNPSIMEYTDEQINLLITLIIKEYTERYYIDYPIWREFALKTAKGEIL